MAETPANCETMGGAFTTWTYGDVTLRELSIGTAWHLQGDPANPSFLACAARWLGVALPLTPLKAVAGSDWTVLWLGPRAWLLLAGVESTAENCIVRRDACNEAGGALFDISASRVVFEVSGPGAAGLLAAFCPLDLHPDVFAPGSCAQSLCGHVTALYHAPAAGVWNVHIARSLGGDIRRLLCATAARRSTSVHAP